MNQCSSVWYSFKLYFCDVVNCEMCFNDCFLGDRSNCEQMSSLLDGCCTGTSLLFDLTEIEDI